MPPTRRAGAVTKPPITHHSLAPQPTTSSATYCRPSAAVLLLPLQIRGSSGEIKFNWKFLVADVTLRVFGTDFLSHFLLLVDVAHWLLVKIDSYLSTPLQTAPSNLALHIIAPTDTYAHLLTSCTDVFRLELSQTPMSLAKHGIYSRIKTKGTPVFTKFRRMVSNRLAAVKQTFAEINEMGLCQKASTSWSSPLHMILEKDDSLLLCGDYVHLSMQTELDHFHIPNYADVIFYLQKVKAFSTLDLLKGSNQGL
ncbi:uncharacterized protein [Palaemon carinicauda]|uniref:uncharacterized protein n=1 Tax=Palaemon carinicauda TaxID=392227 RepID=UPI0035B607CE